MRSSKGGGKGSGKNAFARLVRTSKQGGLGQALVILIMILPQMATDGKRSKGSEILQSLVKEGKSWV